MRTHEKDKAVLRVLVNRTAEVASQKCQEERRLLWKEFNSLRTHQVPLYILDPQGISHEVLTEKDLVCTDPLFRNYEYWLKLQLYHASFGDDYITEPWIPLRPVYANENPHWASWGIDLIFERIQETMAYHLKEPAVKSKDDLARLVLPYGIIDSAKTKEKMCLLEEAFGDILPLKLDCYPRGVFNLSYLLGCFLGPGELLYLLYDEPELVHALSEILSKGFMAVFDDAEKKGWLTNCNNIFLGNAEIQAMAYCHELPSPGDTIPVSMKEHWVYDQSQEFESVSPEMFYEFLLRYQLPFYEKFGLTAYGCCENLTDKIQYLKQISNLRRVAVTPWADNEKCAEQLQDQYIVSWRPNPSEMIANGFDEDRIKTIVKKAKEIFDSHGCYWEVNLKDFLSVGHDARRLENWVRVVREALDQ